MALFRHDVPADVRDRAGLARGERVLAAAESEMGWLLGSRDRLVVVPAEGEVLDVPWQRVDRARWDSETRTLTVSEVGSWGEPTPEHRFAFSADAGPVRLLELLRERVTASIVLQRTVPVIGKRGFTVNARRPPSGAGDLTWLVDYDAGVDPADPAVATAVDRALAAAQAEVY